MISLDTVDRLLADADPLAATSDVATPPPSSSSPHDRHRRVLALTGAGLAAAAVVALTAGLVADDATTSTSHHGAHPAAIAALPDARARSALRLVADTVDTSTATSPTTVTTRERLLDVRQSRDGRVLFWQTIVLHQTNHEHSTDYAFDFGQPQFLTPRDASRAQNLEKDNEIYRGRREQHDAGGTSDDRIPDALLARLPRHDPHALLRSLQAAINSGVIGGRIGGPGYQAANLQELLSAPNTPALLRAAAIRALGYARGISVLGYRTVNGHRGIAIRSAGGFANQIGPETLVVDTHTGLILSDVTRLGRSGAGQYEHRVPLGTVVDSIVVEN